MSKLSIQFKIYLPINLKWHATGVNWLQLRLIIIFVRAVASKQWIWYNNKISDRPTVYSHDIYFVRPKATIMYTDWPFILNETVFTLHYQWVIFVSSVSFFFWFFSVQYSRYLYQTLIVYCRVFYTICISFFIFWNFRWK